VPSVVVDGVNVLAVYDAAKSAVERARAGGGPTFIEAPVYRSRAHGGAGDDSRSGYRDEAEGRAWAAFCPLKLFGEHLTAAGVLSDRAVAAMEDEIAGEIADAFAFALASPHPAETELFRYVYAD
jgi:pyruvate dehydrogenase E1 component alpha subunit